MLIDSPQPELQIGLRLIVPVTLAISGILLFLVTLAVHAQRARPVSGMSGMLDEVGYALTPIQPGAAGRVRTHGEIWTATSDEPIESGSSVRVTAVDGLRLHVTGTGVRPGSDGGQTGVRPPPAANADGQ